MNPSIHKSGSPETPPIILSASSQNASQTEYRPMEQGTGITSTLEALLKHPERVMFQINLAEQGKLLASLLGIILLCLSVYGLIVGTFSGGEQLWAAPFKITIGMFLSTLICLPSLYIFACLNGLDVKISRVSSLLFAAVALNSVLLIGFAPVAWIFSQSTNSVAFMGTLHLFFWAIGANFGLKLLFKGLGHQKADELQHLRVWGTIFILVVMQMTTTLRPIVGTSETFLPEKKKFFITHWMDSSK